MSTPLVARPEPVGQGRRGRSRSGFTLAAFLAIQARGAHPMVPLELFRSRTVSAAVAVGFAFIVGYYGLPFVMSLYLQQLRGLSPVATGPAFLPMMLVGAVLTPFSARLAERLGARMLIGGGLVLMTVGDCAGLSTPSRKETRTHMRDWTPEELDRIGGADELEIATLGLDGTLRPPPRSGSSGSVTTWTYAGLIAR